MLTGVNRPSPCRLELISEKDKEAILSETRLRGWRHIAHNLPLPLLQKQPWGRPHPGARNGKLSNFQPEGDTTPRTARQRHAFRTKHGKGKRRYIFLQVRHHLRAALAEPKRSGGLKRPGLQLVGISLCDFHKETAAAKYAASPCPSSKLWEADLH